MKHRNHALHPLFVLCLAVFACDEQDPSPELEEDVDPGARQHLSPNPGSAAEGSPSAEAPHVAAPRPVAPEAKKSFETMLALIESDYVDQIGEDEIWTGAMEGVMKRLIQLEGHEVNTVLDPSTLEHLLSGTKGSIVGIGIEIGIMVDTLVVKGVIPGGPAEAAGLAPGDRILGVDGTSLKGKPLADSVGLIRGEAGTKVDLFVQRDTEEWTVEVERSVIAVESVHSKMLDESVGYASVQAFSETTPADLDRHLGQLGEAGMRALVLDLRHNPGGLFDTAIDTADRFLPVGTRIVSVRGRKGDKDFEAKNEDPWESIPMAVLIGPETASGAEILAAALERHGRATLIGEPTIGKGTVEMIHDLPNGWALKLSTSRFFSPDDQPRQGVPVEPNIRVTPREDGDSALDVARELLARAP